MADCVVLGGNGFLGSYLVDALAATGHRVTVLDRFSAGSANYSASGVTRIVGSIDNPTTVAEAVRDNDVVFHFAGSTTPVSSLENPLAVVQNEVAGIVPLLEAAGAAGAARVVFASTGGAIYGEAATGAAVSEAVAPSPISPYGIGKLAVEGFLRYFSLTHGLDTVSLRIANPYGARQRPDRRQGLIPILLRRLAEDREVAIYGNGTMIRDYIFAPDVARAAARFADAEHQFPVYNVGSGIGFSVREVLDLAVEVSGHSPRVEQLPTIPGFVERSVLDVSRFDSEFGPAAVVGLRDGIARTWSELQSEAR